MAENKALVQVLLHLPENVRGYWMAKRDVHAVLRRGGFANIPEQDISNFLKGTRDNNCIQRDQLGGERYYAFVP